MDVKNEIEYKCSGVTDEEQGSSKRCLGTKLVLNYRKCFEVVRGRWSLSRSRGQHPYEPKEANHGKRRVSKQKR